MIPLVGDILASITFSVCKELLIPAVKYFPEHGALSTSKGDGTTDIVDLPADEAEDVLEHESVGIPKSMLHITRVRLRGLQDDTVGSKTRGPSRFPIAGEHLGGRGSGIRYVYLSPEVTVA